MAWSWRTLLLVLGIAASSGLPLGTAAPPASAQGQPPVPTFTDMVLAWSVGDYIAPVICQLPDGPSRVARNLSIRPPKKRGYRLQLELEIVPMATGPTACTNDLGEPEPEVRAQAKVDFRGSTRTDTARRDFQEALRRNRGFEYRLEGGQMQVGDGESKRTVNLAGGVLSIHTIPTGTDAGRMLGNVGSLAKRSLVIEARDGTRLVFHAVHVVPRP